jgi:hypothetical protein
MGGLSREHDDSTRLNAALPRKNIETAVYKTPKLWFLLSPAVPCSLRFKSALSECLSSLPHTVEPSSRSFSNHPQFNMDERISHAYAKFSFVARAAAFPSLISSLSLSLVFRRKSDRGNVPKMQRGPQRKHTVEKKPRKENETVITPSPKRRKGLLRCQ